MQNRMTVEIDQDTGKISFDLIDWLEWLSEDQRERLTGFFHDMAYREMERMVRDEYAAPRYNSAIHDLRVKFLTCDEAPEQIRHLVKNLIHDVKQAEEDKKRYEDAYYKMYHAWPEDHWRERPVKAKWAHANVTSDEVEAKLAEAGVTL